MSDMSYMGVLGRFGTLPAALVARLARTNVVTARRWRRQNRAPAAILALLELTLDGPLGQIAPEWEGWRLRRGELQAPNGMSFKPQELLSLPLKYQLIAEYRASARRRAEAASQRREAVPDDNSERLPLQEAL